MSRWRVLMIEDQDDLVQPVKKRLAWIDCELMRARGLDDWLPLARDKRPDFIILDLGLDGEEYAGMTILSALQRNPETADIPVLVMSMYVTENKVRPVRHGARWVIDKNEPNALELLEATIEGELERRERTRPAPASNGLPLWYDAERDALFIRGVRHEPSGLRPNQSRVLAYLCARPGRVCSAEELSEAAYGDRAAQSPDAVEKMMGRLGEKLGDGERYLGKLGGYRWKLLDGEEPASA